MKKYITILMVLLLLPLVVAVIDTDHDGIADRKDDCPTVAGPADNNGCPLLNECQKLYPTSTCYELADWDNTLQKVCAVLVIGDKTYVVVDPTLQCAPSAPPAQSPCTANSQCGAGKVCSNGQCVAPQAPPEGPVCTTNSDCDPNFSCISGNCIQTTPTPNPTPTPSRCSSNSQCGTGQLCVNGQCVAPNVPISSWNNQTKSNYDFDCNGTVDSNDLQVMVDIFTQQSQATGKSNQQVKDSTSCQKVKDYMDYLIANSHQKITFNEMTRVINLFTSWGINPSQACPKDLKICLDGTKLTRQEPQCEFPDCPLLVGNACSLLDLDCNTKTEKEDAIDFVAFFSSYAPLSPDKKQQAIQAKYSTISCKKYKDFFGQITTDGSISFNEITEFTSALNGCIPVPARVFPHDVMECTDLDLDCNGKVNNEDIVDFNAFFSSYAGMNTQQKQQAIKEKMQKITCPKYKVFFSFITADGTISFNDITALNAKISKCPGLPSWDPQLKQNYDFDCNNAVESNDLQVMVDIFTQQSQATGKSNQQVKDSTSCQKVKDYMGYLIANNHQKITFNEITRVINLFTSWGINPSQACPKDLKICLDGTKLTRQEPQCEFPDCPTQPVEKSIVFTLDTSGSMEGKIGNSRKIDMLKTVFLDLVNNNRNNKTKIGIVSFNDQATIISPLTDDYRVLGNLVQNMHAYGSTAIGDGLSKSLEVLANKKSKRYIVLLSDGVDTTRSNPIQITSSRIVPQGIEVYTIGFGKDADVETLKRIANMTGGKYYYATDSDIVLKSTKADLTLKQAMTAVYNDIMNNAQQIQTSCLTAGQSSTDPNAQCCPDLALKGDFDSGAESSPNAYYCCPTKQCADNGMCVAEGVTYLYSWNGNPPMDRYVCVNGNWVKSTCTQSDATRMCPDGTTEVARNPSACTSFMPCPTTQPTPTPTVTPSPSPTPTATPSPTAVPTSSPIPTTCNSAGQSSTDPHTQCCSGSALKPDYASGDESSPNAYYCCPTNQCANEGGCRAEGEFYWYQDSSSLPVKRFVCSGGNWVESRCTQTPETQSCPGNINIARLPSTCQFPNCPATTPTCTDGIQNQAETGIDCGGSCPACPQQYTPKAVVAGDIAYQNNKLLVYLLHADKSISIVDAATKNIIETKASLNIPNAVIDMELEKNLAGEVLTIYIMDSQGKVYSIARNSQTLTTVRDTAVPMARDLELAYKPNSQRTSSQTSGFYILDGKGGIQTVGQATPNADTIAQNIKPGWNWDIARDLEVAYNSVGVIVGFYILDGWGGVHSVGPTVPTYQQINPQGGAPYWQGDDRAKDIELYTIGTTYGIYLLEKSGKVYTLPQASQTQHIMKQATIAGEFVGLDYLPAQGTAPEIQAMFSKEGKVEIDCAPCGTITGTGPTATITFSEHTLTFIFKSSVPEEEGDIILSDNANLISKEWNADRTRLKVTVNGNEGETGNVQVSTTVETINMLIDGKQMFILPLEEQPAPITAEQFVAVEQKTSNIFVLMVVFIILFVFVGAFVEVIYLKNTHAQLQEEDAKNLTALQSYILMARNRDQKDTAIKEELIRLGWKPSLIRKAFEIIK